jgi:hypothetical protein
MLHLHNAAPYDLRVADAHQKRASNEQHCNVHSYQSRSPNAAAERSASET